jgi:cytochrome bd-type quinol oxidase subunit 2
MTAVAGPVPPDFHWGLVLLLSVITCSLFGWAWLIVEAAYIRKIDKESNGILWSVLSFVLVFLSWFTNGISHAMDGQPSPWSGVFLFAALILYLVAIFQMRSDLEDYYNIGEPINLKVNGVMTFFFAIFYFQHHFSRIAQWKKSGVLQPQG